MGGTGLVSKDPNKKVVAVGAREEEEKEAESDVDDPARDPFEPLLESAPESVVRETLRQLCMNNRNTKYLARESLADKMKLIASVHRSDPANTTGSKRPRAETCAGCGKEFHKAENPLGACKFYKYHPDQPEMDDDPDLWPDDDWDIRTTSFSDHPQGWFYPCCGRYGQAPPCSYYRHVALAPGRALKIFKA